MNCHFLKLLIAALALTLTQNCCAQRINNNISSQDYYDFFNSLVNPDSVQNFNLESNPDFSHILDDTALLFKDSSLFSTADIQFMKSQINAAQGFTWEGNKILGARVIRSKKIDRFFKKTSSDVWEKFNRKYKNGFSTFSVPLFTVDRNTCIVYKAVHCGWLCGHGGINLYKKINGKWTFVQSIGTIWISKNNMNELCPSFTFSSWAY